MLKSGEIIVPTLQKKRLKLREIRKVKKITNSSEVSQLVSDRVKNPNLPHAFASALKARE